MQVAAQSLAHAKGGFDLACSLPEPGARDGCSGTARTCGVVGSRRLARGLATLVGLLTKQLPNRAFTTPEEGLVLWIRLPHGSSTELARVARQHGVAILPGTAVSPSGGGDDRIRVPFTLSRKDLADATQRLASAWHAYERSTTLRSRVVV